MRSEIVQQVDAHNPAIEGRRDSGQYRHQLGHYGQQTCAQKIATLSLLVSGNPENPKYKMNYITYPIIHISLYTPLVVHFSNVL